MNHAMKTFVLGPVLLLQGARVRRRVQRLPEAAGPRSGTAGCGPRLRLFVLGDSAAAGVGAARQGEALVGRIVAALAPHRTVDWTLSAVTGATTRSTLERLRALELSAADVAVTSLGVNDVTSGLGLAGWRRQQRELRFVLRDRLGVSHIVVSGLPPVRHFPALPQPLRWYLGTRAEEFSRNLRDDVDTDAACSFVDLTFTQDAGLMAPDGFHPGPEIYREWGRRVAEAILRPSPARQRP